MCVGVCVRYQSMRNIYNIQMTGCHTEEKLNVGGTCLSKHLGE